MKYEVWRVKNDCYTGCKNTKIAKFYSKKKAKNFIRNCEDCCLLKKSNAKYYLYRNLHRDCFSIKHKGKVIAHEKSLILYNVKFKVSEKGRQKVLEEKRKNVHAYLVFDKYEVIEEKINTQELIEIYYNPYTTKHFIIKKTNEPIFQAKKVLAYQNKIYLISNNNHTN